MPLHCGPLVPICMIDSFVFKNRVYKISNKRTNGKPENILPPPASMAWRGHKNRRRPFENVGGKSLNRACIVSVTDNVMTTVSIMQAQLARCTSRSFCTSCLESGSYTPKTEYLSKRFGYQVNSMQLIELWMLNSADGDDGRGNVLQHVKRAGKLSRATVGGGNMPGSRSYIAVVS